MIFLIDNWNDPNFTLIQRFYEQFFDDKDWNYVGLAFNEDILRKTLTALQPDLAFKIVIKPLHNDLWMGVFYR